MPEGGSAARYTLKDFPRCASGSQTRQRAMRVIVVYEGRGRRFANADCTQKLLDQSNA
jgi:hypothetical protein